MNFRSVRIEKLSLVSEKSHFVSSSFLCLSSSSCVSAHEYFARHFHQIRPGRNSIQRESVFLHVLCDYYLKRNAHHNSGTSMACVPARAHPVEP